MAQIDYALTTSDSPAAFNKHHRLRNNMLAVPTRPYLDAMDTFWTSEQPLNFQ